MLLLLVFVVFDHQSHLVLNDVFIKGLCANGRELTHNEAINWSLKSAETKQ